MKRKLIISFLILAGLCGVQILTTSGAPLQTLPAFIQASGTLVQLRISSSSVQIQSLGSGGNPCVSISNSSGTLATSTCGGGGGGGGSGGVGTSTLGNYAPGNIGIFLSSSTLTATSGLNAVSSTGSFFLAGTLNASTSITISGIPVLTTSTATSTINGFTGITFDINPGFCITRTLSNGSTTFAFAPSCGVQTSTTLTANQVVIGAGGSTIGTTSTIFLSTINVSSSNLTSSGVSQTGTEFLTLTGTPTFQAITIGTQTGFIQGQNGLYSATTTPVLLVNGTSPLSFTAASATGTVIGSCSTCLTTSTWVINASGTNILTNNQGGSSTIWVTPFPTFSALTVGNQNGLIAGNNGVYAATSSYVLQVSASGTSLVFGSVSATGTQLAWVTPFLSLQTLNVAGISSLASTTVAGQATTTNLSITGVPNGLIGTDYSGKLIATTTGVTAGSCTNCNLSIDASGRVLTQTNGSAGGGGSGGVGTSTPIYAFGVAYFIPGSSSSTLQTNSSFTFNATSGLFSAPSGTFTQNLTVGTSTINGTGSLLVAGTSTFLNKLIVGTTTQYYNIGNIMEFSGADFYMDKGNAIRFGNPTGGQNYAALVDSSNILYLGDTAQMTGGISLRPGAAEEMRVTSSGVGILTQFPSSTLHVVGTFQVTQSSTFNRFAGTNGCASFDANGALATSTCSGGSGGGGGVVTSSPTYSFGVAYFIPGGSSSTLQTNASFTFNATSGVLTVGSSSLANASITALTVTGSSQFIIAPVDANATKFSTSTVTNALLLGAAGPSITAYGGAGACSGTGAVTTISIAGATTCATFLTVQSLSTSTSWLDGQLLIGELGGFASSSDFLEFTSSTGLFEAPSGTFSGSLVVGSTTPNGIFSVATPSGTVALQVNATGSILFAVATSSATTTLSGANTYFYVTPTSTIFSQANVGFTTSSVSMGACGTSPSVVGSNNAGSITTGSSGVTACTLDFAVATSSIGTPWINPPVCVISDNNTTAVSDITSITSSTLNLGFASALTSVTVNYICFGNPN